MTGADAAVIERVNALGARWGRGLDFTGGQVWTALGVWPLLAVLAAGAGGPAREELAGALGVPVERAPAAARELLARVGSVPGCTAALGLWTAGGVEVEPDWLERLDASLWGRLTGDEAEDRAALDGWVRERTGGLVDRMPVELSGALLVLASALTVRTEWAKPFRPSRSRAAEGPWARRRFTRLTASGPELYERIAVAETSAGPVTEVRVVGGGEVDVHLVLGAEAAEPGAVVAAGFELLSGAARRMPVAGLSDGEAWPGLELESVESSAPRDSGVLETVAFRVRAEHDLLARAGLFGLGAAAGPGGHFPGISRGTPLRVCAAEQAAVAEFTATGFEASAVTVVEMTRSMVGGPARFRSRRATARFDRPFGFLAVHRPTGLVLVAGWVAEPAAA
ncbi:serpin family protein [Kitasatospora phosalacinea]|uniref:serpin family protein n=1 Tax=Kitasatospora phosalacinea TaxID=2065 RepID=UPI000525FE0D|nr:serpin family protein [Kitasatospora phosalacinea]